MTLEALEARVRELEVQLEAEQRERQTLTDRLNKWAANGLHILDAARLFAGSGGLYGTDEQAARVDHTH